MNEIERIESSAKRIKRIARVLYVAFTVVFWCVVIATAAITLMMSMRGISDFSIAVDIPLISSCLKFMLEMLTVLLMVWIMKRMFKDIAQGESPFSMLQARRLRLVAAMQLLHAVLITVTSPAILRIIGLGDLAIGATIGSASAEGAARFIPINAGDIVLAIVLFCAALIVEYGSLLQKLSDDTL